ncbi:MAG: peptide chain release factor N(5)-glutamine methyltransferase [Flavobacteriaceae bacterium]|jgi:release factor glutamine methyltransferase|nr:peptide chain release factor N(5)-glutamine methyltransferase [Flavobacteriaceae bacterium]MBT4112429.1 peptide chain release factor N(5)-glutamine methyltransferase [Flavobacteriaceae bacterium]MBT4614283.1 peptide chain release factor N(5)-glutamine methyltransferase [Flavobacteriaceae bacterium]MBT5246736.1 peptide chain release factor N(5)-glutamine methyltransferase [Flavobacteriaceae bacterium]MBT5649921.1 peptide chain release factor N(5)-glutamine methyltransferase [Flavobacteriaceae
MKLASFKKEFLESITPLYNNDEARSLYYMLCEEYLALSKSKLIIAEDIDLSVEKTNHLYNCLERLKKNEPIQYVLGNTKFCGLNFFVNESVLIPRPETEELVNIILKNELGDKTILDIGSGSGCIAISLAKYYPNAKVTALDVSKDAIDLSKMNAKENDVNLEFINADILNYKSDKKYDIIVSNPPYVLEEEKKHMSKNILDYEPELALFVKNDDPLQFYKAILEFAKNSLNKYGKIYFEINEKYKDEIKRLTYDYGYSNIECKEDLFGRNRFCVIL